MRGSRETTTRHPPSVLPSIAPLTLLSQLRDNSASKFGRSISEHKLHAERFTTEDPGRHTRVPLGSFSSVYNEHSRYAPDARRENTQTGSAHKDCVRSRKVESAFEQVPKEPLQQ
jgi:hypothetical protein